MCALCRTEARVAPPRGDYLTGWVTPMGLGLFLVIVPALTVLLLASLLNQG